MLVTDAATVIAVAPCIPLIVAVIVAFPTPAALTSPALTVATLALEVVQLAVDVMSLELPSLYLPVAVSWRVSPTFIAAEDDEPMLIELNVAADAGGGVEEELPPPQPEKNDSARSRHGRTARRNWYMNMAASIE